jgi:hypothetical protein
MHRSICAAAVLAGTLTTTGVAQTFSSETTDLIEQFGTELVLADEDGDSAITDLDFILLVLDRLLEGGLEDYDCNGVIDEIDAVKGLTHELASLASDFDGSGTIDTTDIEHVTINLGTADAKAREGDVNGDSQVDAVDFLNTCDRLGTTVSLDPVETAYAILESLLDLEPWMASLSMPIGQPCAPPEQCGSALCRVRCVNAATGGSWTYRLFMVGFCGSQFEATTCCDAIKVIACGCSTNGFSLSCWAQAQGAFIACLIAAPG